jgi:hypothetical protein
VTTPSFVVVEPAVPSAVLERVRAALAATGAEPTPSLVAATLQAEGRILGDAGVLAVVDALRRESVGAGPLEPLLRSPGVTDVLVNGARAVYVDRGNGLEISEVTFPNEDAVRRLAQRLAGTGGRRLDDATPFVDVRLPDATRFHAVLAPVARPGTCLSLRVPARRAFTLAELVAAEALSAEGAALLADIVAARLAFLVSGGTAAARRPCSPPCSLLSRPRSGSSWSRTRTSSPPSMCTWWAWRLAHPTSKARGRSCCATWFARRCGCAPTGWSSGRCAVPRIPVRQHSR